MKETSFLKQLSSFGVAPFNFCVVPRNRIIDYASMQVQVRDTSKTVGMWTYSRPDFLLLHPQLDKVGDCGLAEMFLELKLTIY